MGILEEDGSLGPEQERHTLQDMIQRDSWAGGNESQPVLAESTS